MIKNWRYRHTKPQIPFFWWYYQYKKIDPHKIKLDELDIIIYYIGYVRIKNSKYVKIISVNPLYIIINKVEEYLVKINII